jgi:serine/threonine protein kinase
LTADLACRSYSADILGGLHELHSAGVMVLDLKPSNVLLDGDGGQVRAVLSDFGLARLLQQRHAPGELRAPTISLSGCGALVSAIGSPPSAFHISLKIFSKTQKKLLPLVNQRLVEEGGEHVWASPGLTPLPLKFQQALLDVCACTLWSWAHCSYWQLYANALPILIKAR